MSQAETSQTDEVNRAIQLAKGFLLKAYAGEDLHNLGLEEVIYQGNARWDVTLGFTRRWEAPNAMQATVYAMRPTRTFKVVSVDLEKGQGLTIRNHRGD